MTDHEETTVTSGFRDRKVGLVVFGVLQIALGGICALMAPLMLLGAIMSSRLGASSAAQMSVATMIPGVVFYVLLAVWFIWLGIGSIMARRWARALLLVSSWMWLICGIGGLIAMLLFMPDISAQMAKGGQMPQQMVVIMKCVMIGFMAVIYLVIPGALVLFYRSKHVKATCEFRDPHVRWTDKCPLPVLAVSLIFGFWAVSMLLMGFYHWAIPFFGVVLSGTAGALAAMVVLLLSAYVARGAYRLSLRAWWCSILLVIAWTLSACITFSRVSLLEFYEKMNFPEQQLDMMRQLTVPQSTLALVFGLWVVVFLGFLLYTKRYFGPPSGQEGGARGHVNGQSLAQNGPGESGGTG